MVAVESKNTDPNGQLAPHTVAAIEKHFLGIVNEHMKPLAEEPPGNGSTHAPANGQTEAQQEPVAKTAESTRAAPAQKPAPKTAATKLAKGKIKGGSMQFVSPISEFYLTNPIARASAVMGECAATAAGLRQAAE